MQYATHRKLSRDYTIKDHFEAGIVLSGAEAKSIRLGRAILDTNFVITRGGEVFVVQMDIPPYQSTNAGKTERGRTRKLLLHKKEIIEIQDLLSQKGLTAVVSSLYGKGHKIKAEIAIVQGKKKYDKREDLKKKAIDREIARTLKIR